jgi:hypothetical protein
MPCITLPLDPGIGPIVELGVSAAAALLPAGSPRPPIQWIRAVADTGCSHTSVHTSIAVNCGLKLISKGTTNTPGGQVPCNIYHGDLFLKIALPNGQQFEFPFRGRGIIELVNKIPSLDALLGMDMLSMGTFHVNGLTKNATFCW